MDINFDPAKRELTLVERGLDFADAPQVFAGVTVEMEDLRRDYGEQRILCYGLLAGRFIVWVHSSWKRAPRFQYEEGQ